MSNIPNNFVFEKCLSYIPLKSFRCAHTDTYSKKVLSGHIIMLFINAYLNNQSSLEEMATSLDANEDFQSFLGLKNISASTLSRKLDTLPLEMLQQIWSKIFVHIKEFKREREDPTNDSSQIGPLGILDSSEVKLPKKAGEWAYCSKTKNAIKVHLVLSNDNGVVHPEQFVLSTTVYADHELTDYLMNNKSLTYVMDRGYINYSHFLKWVEEGLRFVVRIKASSKTYIMEDYEVDTSSLVTRDAKVQMKVANTDTLLIVRLVEYQDSEGRTYRVVTNRWDLPAEDIAEIYRRRWSIEIFFKWMKQNLKLEKLFSYKPNAVWNQMYLVFIAFGLCELVKQEVEAKKKTTQQVLKKLQSYWFKPWIDLISTIHRQPQRTSKGRVKKKKRGRPRKHPVILKAQKVLVL